MRTPALLALLLLPPALGGCIAQTAVTVATLPIRAAAGAVDLVTTSQSEADARRGREIRRHEECLGREERRARREDRAPDWSRCDR